eukprot:TRINITY_DN11425_c0_g1_i1.p1 TRINITY_DN11425_c0_g1~~TRINITY_DN11425_c0_g1_i1.p1  ORF type:complete len:386 (+),score=95.93 TRINITY_DN11425_c0_g1_i1:67-1224(+)
MKNFFIFILISTLLMIISKCSSIPHQKPQFGKKPQMGWNSWNKFGCTVNETVMRSTIDTFISLRLPDFGYEFVNVDDCWEAPERAPNGNILSDPKTFPSGMKALADYAHTKGLKFGLYSSAGLRTCAGRPGTMGYELMDAQSYASWGVDYLKYDNCNSQHIPVQIRFETMARALQKAGNNIFFSICEWGVNQPATWAPAIANSWRTTDDISDNWNSMMLNILINDVTADYAGPGAWNDPDMLEVGNGGMDNEEYKSHFSLWCITKAPLLIGCDLTKIKNETLQILTNAEAIAINQDDLGEQAKIVVRESTHLIWKGRIVGGWAVVAVNLLGNGEADVVLNFKNLFGVHSVKIRDLWAHKDLGTFNGSFNVSVKAHRCIFYKIVKA